MRPRFRGSLKMPVAVLVSTVSVIAGCTTEPSPEERAERLAHALADATAGTTYPQRINDEQEITSLTSKGMTVTFRNRFVRLSAADIDVNSINGYRETLRSQVCSTSPFLKAGATQEYTYYDRDDVYLARLSFSLADCR